jgi:hypothetical protein
MDCSAGLHQEGKQPRGVGRRTPDPAESCGETTIASSAPPRSGTCLPLEGMFLPREGVRRIPQPRHCGRDTAQRTMLPDTAVHLLEVGTAR